MTFKKFVRGLARRYRKRFPNSELLWTTCCELLNEMNTRQPDLDNESAKQLLYTFSQHGEDRIVEAFFRDHKPVNQFYVDVGCFHPFDLSNTCLLYRRGWRGINIDIKQEVIDRFNEARPRDRNILAACSNEQVEVTVMSRGGIGAKDYILTEENAGHGFHDETQIENAPTSTQTLTSIIDSTDHRDMQIDYLDVDCEGHDLNVLEGLDIERFRPQLLAIEGSDDTPISEYLSRYRYKKIAQTFVTHFYA